MARPNQRKPRSVTGTNTPPLNWLRAFEAAGRLGSFKAAAEALNVSPSTVSHQIRDLEKQLGQPLFIRGAKSIELTQEGASLLTPLSAGFELISNAFEPADVPTSEFRIGSMPFLTNEVLLPNVDKIKQVLGCTQLSFRSETSVAALSHPQAQHRLDAVVRYANTEPGPGLAALDLFDIELVPIQAIDKPSFTNPQKLLEQPIIRIVGPFDAWQEWARQHGVVTNPEYPPQNIALETDNYHAATLAATRGDGMCLGVMPFMQPWLRAGKIQTLDAFRCTIPYKACLVFSAHNQGNPMHERLRDWLVDHLTGS